MKIRMWLSTCAFVILTACSSAQHSFPEFDFPSRSVNVGGVSYGYRIYLPPNRKEGEKMPVMLYLHGSNRRGTDNQEQIRDLVETIREKPQNFPFIVVMPQCRPGTFWAGPMMDMAMAALDETVKDFNGDEERRFIAGYSLGGFGVWQTAITHPGTFAALVSVAGGVEPLGRVSDEDRALLSPQVQAAASSSDPYKAYADALRTLPVWVVHGADDDAVPVDASRKIVAALKAAGNATVNYVELEGVGHGSLQDAFDDTRLTEWLGKQRLNLIK